MALTKKQLDEIIAIIDRHMLTIMADVVGDRAMTPDEIQKMKDFGLLKENVRHMTIDPVQYGRVVALLPEDIRKKLSKADIEKMIKKLKPTTDTERAAMEYASNNVGEHIRGLRDSMVKDVRVAVAGQALQEVRQSVVAAIEDRQTPSELKTILFDKFDDRNRDWQRVASTEMNDAIQFGIAAEIKRTSDEGADQLVYKRPNPDACFLPGTMVMSRRGNVPIEDLIVGDYVLTHRLRWRMVQSAYSRSYCGTIVCVDGVHSTRNHLFLSNMNWARTDSLKRGDKIIRLTAFDPKNNPSVFSKEFFLEHIPGSCLPRLMPLSSIKLYCDLFLRDSDVDVVSTNRKLKDWFKLIQEFGDTSRFFCRILKGALFGNGDLISGFWKVCKSNCDIGVSGHRSFLRFTQRLIVEKFCFRMRPVNPIAKQDLPYVARRQSKVSANVCDGSGSKGIDDLFIAECDKTHIVSKVVIDHIQQITTYSYTGQVFNLEIEDDHSYFAGGIAVHNCVNCNRLYLDSGIPRIFKLSEMAVSNVGRKAADWLPTIGAVHPWCHCQLHVLPEGFGFKKKNVVAQKFEDGGKIFNIGQEISDSEIANLSAENKTKIRQEPILEFIGWES
jgi:hypothetical protein